MSTKSKRLMSLLLAMGLCLIAPEALAWSWNQHQPRPYNGFEGQSPDYGPSGYGYYYYRLSLLPGLSLLTARATGSPRAAEPRQWNFPRATSRRECRRGVWARTPRLPTARAAAGPLSGDHLATRLDAPAGKVLGVTPMCVKLPPEPTR